MDKALEESIKEFEIKKEFREVKLKTRQSFREDQAALERRLSRRETRMSNGVKNGHAGNGHVEKCRQDEANDSVLSKLEGIVVDIGAEKENENKDLTDEIIVIDTVESRSWISAMDNKKNLSECSGNNRTKQVCNAITDKPNSVPESQQNGQTTTHQHKMNGSVPTRGVIPNGHTFLHNGQTSTPSSFHMGTSENKQLATTMTPEPRIKAFKGIYQKNPKLTAASTEHLDKISLKGFKPSGFISNQGQRTEYQQTGVPRVSGTEVTSIPADGNLSGFNVEQMVTIFRLLRIPEDIVYRFSKCNVDGKRFAVFTDSELNDLGINNPVIRYFRDRTAKTHKRKSAKFML